jgi:two-component system, NarL family, invasion response regulator UvrY
MNEIEDDPPRFLLADDHAVVRRGVREMLREEFPNAIFGEASTAQEALDRAWAEPWDLVVLDISMPGRSGLDILRDLKAARPRAAILVQSMHAEDQFARRVLKAGASGYITKDSMPRELLKAVQKAMDGGRYVSESLAEKLAGAVAADSVDPHERLSDREFQVCRMLARGAAIKEISAELSLSVKTISTYRARILEKLDVRSNVELAQYAERNGLIE